MSDANHTPGPWHEKYGHNIFGQNDRLVANCGGHSQNFDVEATEAESEANARLIASAPELLAALQMIDRILRDVQEYEHAWANHPEKPEKTPATVARAAIAKATGEGEG